MALSVGDVLVRCGIEVPRVREALPHVEPFAVPLRVPNRAFRATWAKGIVAVATPWAVYVTADIHRRLVAGEDSERLGLLMVHELTHLEQYRRLGIRRHITGYVGEYARARTGGKAHWDAYRDISLEAEARATAAAFGQPRNNDRVG